MLIFIRMAKEKAVYRILDTETMTSYVGATTYSTASRFGKHQLLLEAGVHHCKPLQSAWNIRQNDFLFEVLEVFEPSADIWFEEQKWWDRLNAIESVFNRRPNREHRPHWTPEEKAVMAAKISETRKAKIASREYMTGWDGLVRLYGEDGAKEKNRLAALGNKNAIALKGSVKTESHKQSLSESAKRHASILLECEICGQECRGKSALGRHKQAKHKRTRGEMVDTQP